MPKSPDASARNKTRRIVYVDDARWQYVELEADKLKQGGDARGKVSEFVRRLIDAHKAAQEAK